MIYGYTPGGCPIMDSLSDSSKPTKWSKNKAKRRRKQEELKAAKDARLVPKR